MRQLFLPIIVSLLLLADVSFARTVEVEVHGMTCAFCVDSLERKFRKMDSVKEVQVSLKAKLIRLETDEKPLRDEGSPCSDFCSRNER